MNTKTLLVQRWREWLARDRAWLTQDAKTELRWRLKQARAMEASPPPGWENARVFIDVTADELEALLDESDERHARGCARAVMTPAEFEAALSEGLPPAEREAFTLRPTRSVQ